MVVVGIAAAVAVLAGALLVGASVRDSLRELALGRLGATDVVVSSQTFFRSALSDSLTTSSSTSPVQSAAPDRRGRRRGSRRVEANRWPRDGLRHRRALRTLSRRRRTLGERSRRAREPRPGRRAWRRGRRHPDHPRRAADRHSAVDDSGPKGAHRRPSASRCRSRARRGAAVGGVFAGAGARAGSRRLRANEAASTRSGARRPRQHAPLEARRSDGDRSRPLQWWER